MSHFGDFVRECRDERHMTQRVLAEKLGIASTVLSDVERGKRPPFCPCRMIKLSAVLKVPLSAVVIAASRECHREGE